MPQSPAPHVVEVAFTKNEGRFLLEWIAYHRLIGVGEFLIYTNDCEDESQALLDRLQEMGLATHVPNPIGPGEQPQNKALNRAATHPLVKAAEYVLQIDPDEFLCIKAGAGRIADLLATAPQADAICVQMRFFGDGGHASMPDGLVIEHLTHASPEDFEPNAIVKSIARNSQVFEKVTANHMPAFAPGAKPKMFNAGGQQIALDARSNRIPDGARSMRYAQLNHYAVRTFADYCAKKHRGTPAGNDAKLTLAYWRQRNRNDVEDTTILKHAPATKALMAEWLNDPVLAKRNARCFEAYAAIVEKSRDIFA